MDNERIRYMITSLFKMMPVVLFVVLLVQERAMCADIVVDKSKSNQEHDSISITGVIKQGDDLVFTRLVKGTKNVWVNLDSVGGDVDAGIGIGSAIRKHDGIVSTGKCYSSCVLIVAGGVIRVGASGFGDPVIGVHRIFFSELQPGLTSSQIKTLYDAQLNRIRNYLAKMNVAPELLSFMQSIEPSDMHILTQMELNLYGLRSQDVIFNERMIADRAEELEISSIEYRKREQRGLGDECVGEAQKMVPTEQERAEAIKLGISVEMVLRTDCAMAIKYGTSVETYRLRSSQVNERCRGYIDQMQQNRCVVHFMSTGRATP